MEKLIKLNNEFYLLNDEQVKRGDKAMDKNNHIQTYNPYGSDYDTERNFTKVIASTNAFAGLTMLNKPQIELMLGNFIDIVIPMNKTLWDVEIEKDKIPADRAPNGWDEFPKKNEQGYITIKSIK